MNRATDSSFQDSSQNNQPFQQLPPIDMQSMINSYYEMKNSGTVSKVLIDIYGVMLNVFSNQTELDLLKSEVIRNEQWIQELENKIGAADEVSEKLGLAIRNLPHPPYGRSELDNTRDALAQINAPGIDASLDVVKAIRVGQSEANLGTVKVEIRNEKCRASIMKTKKCLANHQNNIMKKLIIKNLKSKSQMSLENFGNDLLQLIPGGNNMYILENGHLKRKHQVSAHNSSNPVSSYPFPPQNIFQSNPAVQASSQIPTQSSVQFVATPDPIQPHPQFGLTTQAYNNVYFSGHHRFLQHNTTVPEPNNRIDLQLSAEQQFGN